MAKVNEIKEQQIVVASVGGFANSLQQIATMRMTSLRKAVLASRRFVDEATLILRELKREKQLQFIEELEKIDKKLSQRFGVKRREAIIVVSSYQGLCGSYNTEIIAKLEKILPEHLEADYFVIGSKGQDYFRRQVSKNPNLNYYPYDIPEEVQIEDLKRLISMFVYYDQIYLVYSKYINTATREVVFLELAEPAIETEEDKEKEEENEGKFIFEPDLDDLIESVTAKLRYSLFRQQILDSKLSLYSAQMVAMQTASDNAKDLLKDLQMEYNKARRKQIDKKIQEVQAGRALWAE
ncbi:F0F1 ATP synthase subunit gamma [Candidatus Beckwithbacteria bacterium]|nr:F0F1 ATP synthase subunit gamma [Candidatus Beckwithbacteria bacterium]